MLELLAFLLAVLRSAASGRNDLIIENLLRHQLAVLKRTGRGPKRFRRVVGEVGYAVSYACVLTPGPS